MWVLRLVGLGILVEGLPTPCCFVHMYGRFRKYFCAHHLPPTVTFVLPPQFTMFLKRDYARWAEGDDSRAAVVAEGEALIAPEEG